MKLASTLVACVAPNLLLLLPTAGASPAGSMRGTAARALAEEDAPRAAAPLAVNGTKLMNMIDCFAWYLENAAHRPDNSHTDGCHQESIVYCRTDAGHDDRFCKFSGTNVLEESTDTPTCYFNCQMETCNAWTFPHNDDQQKCVDALSH